MILDLRIALLWPTTKLSKPIYLSQQLNVSVHYMAGHLCSSLRLMFSSARLIEDIRHSELTIAGFEYHSASCGDYWSREKECGPTINSTLSRAPSAYPHQRVRWEQPEKKSIRGCQTQSKSCEWYVIFPCQRPNPTVCHTC